MSRDRLEIFSDAVFAVAITLLALNLTIRGPGHGPLTNQLIHQWQAFAAYLISFFTIGVAWVNHHALVSNVAFVTRSLLFFNLVLLLFVVLIPVATRLLADYLSASGFSAHLAAAVYGTVLEGMAVSFYLVLEWTLREGRTRPPVPPDRRWVARARYLLRVAGDLAVIGGAFISPLLAPGLSGALVVYYMFGPATALTSKAGIRPGGADGE
jgi:uncharacterized membrane protein